MHHQVPYRGRSYFVSDENPVATPFGEYVLFRLAAGWIVFFHGDRGVLHADKDGHLYDTEGDGRAQVESLIDHELMEALAENRANDFDPAVLDYQTKRQFLSDSNRLRDRRSEGAPPADMALLMAAATSGSLPADVLKAVVEKWKLDPARSWGLAGIYVKNDGTLGYDERRASLQVYINKSTRYAEGLRPHLDGIKNALTTVLEFDAEIKDFEKALREDGSDGKRWMLDVVPPSPLARSLVSLTESQLAPLAALRKLEAASPEAQLAFAGLPTPVDEVPSAIVAENLPRPR